MVQPGHCQTIFGAVNRSDSRRSHGKSLVHAHGSPARSRHPLNTRRQQMSTAAPRARTLLARAHEVAARSTLTGEHLAAYVGA